ncbi:hypothetical protein DMENIID0001_006320 [Sergentomyia squamirostris]
MTSSREKRQKSSWCSICKIKIITPYDLKVHEAHQREELPLRSFSCDLCEESFSTKTSLKRHFQQVHDGKFCQECGEHFNTVHLYKNHRRTHHSTVADVPDAGTHPGKHQCSVCGLRKRSQKEVEIHMVSHTGEKKFHCSVCSRKFGYATSLKDHMRIRHMAKICSLCHKIFIGYNAYKFHRCGGESKEPPAELSKSPGKKRNRRKSNRAPLFPARKRHPCDQCLKTYSTKYLMLKHKKRDHPVKLEPLYPTSKEAEESKPAEEHHSVEFSKEPLVVIPMYSEKICYVQMFNARLKVKDTTLIFANTKK